MAREVPQQRTSSSSNPLQKKTASGGLQPNAVFLHENLKYLTVYQRAAQTNPIELMASSVCGVFVDLRNEALFYEREKRVVTETHELAQRSDQVMGLPSWLEPTERQTPICTARVFNRTIDRVVGRKRNRHVGQGVHAGWRQPVNGAPLFAGLKTVNPGWHW